MNRKYRKLLSVLFAFALFMGACAFENDADTSAVVSIEETGDYTGESYAIVNGNVPDFTEEEKTTEVFENYSELDELGRCGVAYANICTKLMPTEERGEIGMIKPTGWQTVKYDSVDGKYLYNRCHLIGFQLAGENANERNLITGTRYMNVEGMLPFENQVADYVRETDNHVLYRVTPVYDGDNLLASGVTMEAWSVEDNGAGICFYVYVYNVQPGIRIDYKNGESRELTKEELGNADMENEDLLEYYADADTSEPAAEDFNEVGMYVLNTNTKKFHLPACSSVEDIKTKNKEEYTGTKAELMKQGYEACKRCEP